MESHQWSSGLGKSRVTLLIMLLLASAAIVAEAEGLAPGATEAWLNAVKRDIGLRQDGMPPAGRGLQGPEWTVEGDQQDANCGFSVSTAGDVNGDGYSDVIVGVWAYDEVDGNEGRAYVYLGSAIGPDTIPSWQASGEDVCAYFGACVATAGDVNEDGYDDVLVGAPYEAGGSEAGRAYMYLGSATGLGASPSWQAEGDSPGAYFGFSVAMAGDVNGDGYGDVVVGAAFHNGGQAEEGRAYVYLGSPLGLSTNASWQMELDEAGAWFGYSVACAGDVDADGYDDLIIGACHQGATDRGRAYLYRGSPTGPELIPTWNAGGGQDYMAFGWSVATAGDVDGDGYSDVLIGAPLRDCPDPDEGRAYLYRGDPTGLGASAAWQAEGDQASANFGFSVASAGDVNGDGYSDVVIGAYRYSADQSGEGAAFLYQGSADGLGGNPVWQVAGGQANAGLGFSVATAGDVNGDGYGDVICGLPWFSSEEEHEGRADVYCGFAAGLTQYPTWSANGTQSNDEFGTCVATAGDVNGDGYSDVIIGAPHHVVVPPFDGAAFVYLGSDHGFDGVPAWTAHPDQEWTLFGSSVATAGDVNGDGYSDVIVGAQWYHPGHPPGVGLEGAAFLYLGSAAGLGTEPAWIGLGEQEDEFYGTSVASAGDVNGDGYSDVLVGAIGHDGGEQDEGWVFLYLGSATGLSAQPAWHGEGDQASAGYGYSVSAAGDVNGDGYGDVIIGAPWFTTWLPDEGLALVYLGSGSGLAAEPAWHWEGDWREALCGWAVAAGGDVNGDGYGDVIIGEKSYRTPPSGPDEEGMVCLALGSASGLETTPSWHLEGPESYANFGASVSSAGDVNGDGFSDVVIGAPGVDPSAADEGRAGVYLGSAVGLAYVPAWEVLGDQTRGHFGASVAGGGDVNGDGFSDVVIGEPMRNVGGSREGRVCLYPGNNGDGLDRIPRQERTDETAPIALLGSSDSQSGFRLEALGRTPAGRGSVRLEWEVKLLGTLFDGSDIESGPLTDTGQPMPGIGSARSLGNAVSGLASGQPYHWRLRIASDSPFFPHTPWFSIQGNGPQETDLRTAPSGSGIGAEEEGPPLGLTRLRLEDVRPNPFTPGGHLVYELSRAGHVRLTVFDMQGRQVMVLVDGMQAAGRHAVPWNGRSALGGHLALGAYFALIDANGQTRTQRFTLVK